MQATVMAYAKVNLLLDVLGKRDDGYHEVAMVMQAVSLADRLTITPAGENTITANSPFVPLNMSNLAMKAVALMQARYPQVPPMSVALEKKIPVAAGLAGGSADAAAVLLGIDRLCGLGLTREGLMALAAELGSDVPFCLGTATALATGRGEIIKPLADCPKLWLVMVKPKFGVSTPSVYKNLDLSKVRKHPDLKRYLAGLSAGRSREVLNGMHNVLEQSTFQLHPYVAELKKTLQGMGGRHTMMSGSGPTVFSAFSRRGEALAFYRRVREKYRMVIFTETIGSAVLRERVTIHE